MQRASGQRYDSLINALKKSTEEIHSIKIYHLLAEETAANDFTAAIAFEDSALTLARKINSAEQLSVTLTNIGSFYRNISEYKKSLEYFDQAFKASPQGSPWLSDTYLQAGISLLRMTELDTATKVLETGLSIVKVHPNVATEGALYNAMGNVKREQNQYKEAMNLYFQSLKLFETHKDLQGQTQALSNISNIHNLLGDTDKALDYGLQSLETAKAAKVQSSIAYSHRLLGRIYRKQKKHDEAVKAYADALVIYEKLQARKDVSETESSIGNIYFDKGDFPEAMSHYKNSLAVARSLSDSMLIAYAQFAVGNILLCNKEYKKARAYVDSVLVISEKKNLVYMRMDSYGLLSEIYEAEGNYQLGLSNHRTYIGIRDSVEREQNKAEVREIEARFQSEKKDDAIRILNAENTLKSNQQKYLLVILVLVTALAIILYSRYKVKLKANEKLKALDLVKTRFFTNISHEFRTPLSLILGPLEQKLDSTEGKERESFKLMHRNAKRLQNLINQLLDLSRIEAGSMQLHLEESDVAPILRFVGSSFSSLAERKGIYYGQKIIASHVGCFDRDKLEKIINNLLSNAFKFTPEGGTVHFKAQVGKGQLIIEVKDSGIGIPKEQQQSIFNRFYQVDDSTTRTSEGSGIGLALTKELTELHKGKLSLTSSEGTGSVFTVIIPITRESFSGLTIQAPVIQESKIYFSDEESHPIGAINEDESKPLVLIAEDNADMQKFIVDLLKDSYRTISTFNGQEALARSQEVVPDFIISDWMMPVMDGLAFCEKLKITDATSHIPVLMLTARADQVSKLEGLETGADDYLTKPFDARELLVRIHNLIEQRKKLRKLFSREVVLQPKQISLPSRDAEFLSRLLSLLEAKSGNPDFSVEELSDEVNMSRMQLHRKLKALTDQSPGEFLRKFRLERAKQMLSVPGMQVSEVCYKVGFNNLSNFSKVFKEFTGVTPSEFMSAATEKV
jgi:signal transduction histidine kinase/DNA-binding response OmpR family regulator